MNSRQWRKLTHAARKLGIVVGHPIGTESQSHIERKEPKQQLASSHKPQRLYGVVFSKGWQLLIAILTVLGGVSAMNSLRFDISVDAYASLNPKEPLETRFVLTNQGPYSINKVTYSCEFPGMKLLGVDSKINVVGADVVVFEEKEMDARGKISLRCENPMSMATDSQMQISVSYRPSFWPWRKTGGATFLLKRDDSGNVVWLPIGGTKLIGGLMK